MQIISSKVNSRMLGLEDTSISLGYVMAICSFFFCLIYGIINWHKGIEEKDGDYREEIRWDREEIELIEKLP
jgi:hypothetical protein